MKKVLSKALGMVLLALVAMPAMANIGGNNTYYSKMTAKTGAGKVYVSTQQTNTPDYTDTESSQTQNSEAKSAPTHTYYLYAQANEGSSFAGWYTNEACTTKASGNYMDMPYTATITANSTTQGNPTANTYYAKFAVSKTYYSQMTATVGTGSGSVSASTTATAGTYGNTATASNNTTAGDVPTHDYCLFAQAADGYRFSGWYENPDCSGNPVSTANPYNTSLSANSNDAGTPTSKTYYALFTEFSGLSFTVKANNPSMIYRMKGGSPDAYDRQGHYGLSNLDFSAAGSLNTPEYEEPVYMLYIQADDEYEFVMDVYDAEGEPVISVDNYTQLVERSVPTNRLNNGRVEITAQKLGATQPCTITFQPNCDALKSILIDNTEKINAVRNNQLTSSTGATLVLFPNEEEYTVSSVKVNGSELEYYAGYHGYSCRLSATAVTVEIAAQKNSEMSKQVALMATDLAMIDVFTNNVNYTQGTQLAATPILTLDGNSAAVQVRAKEGYRSLSATYTDSDDMEHEMAFYIDGSNEFYAVNVFDTDVQSINIACAPRSTEKMTATLWIDNLSNVSTYYVRTVDRTLLFDSSDNNKKLTAGGAGNTFEIFTDATPISLTLESSKEEFHSYVTVNGVPVEARSKESSNETSTTYSLSADITFTAGAVIRIYNNQPTLTGDVNNDGKVSLGDVPAAVQYGIGKGVQNGRGDAADTDHDGQISDEEVKNIVNKVLQK